MTGRGAGPRPPARALIAARSVGGAARRLLSRRGAPVGAVVLGYHDVIAGGGPGAGGDHTVTADRLRAHVGLLRRLGFTIVHFGELAADPDRAAIRRLAALTFDDALVGVIEVARPVLAELGAPATVFATTGCPGREPSWWPGARPTVDEESLAELARTGWEIGSHSVHHRSLVTLDDHELRRELVDSRHRLRQVTGQPVDVFAYPSGHHDRRTRSAVAEAGYRAACTFLNGRVEAGEDPLRLPRLTMGPHSTTVRLAYHLLRDPASWPDHRLERVGPRDHDRPLP